MTATVISGATGSIDGDNTSATLEPGEAALLYNVNNLPYDTNLQGGGRSVWYQWTCPATGYYGFYTGATDGSFETDRGLGNSLISIIDGNDFFTAQVIVQNQLAGGLEQRPDEFPGFFDFPWSLAQLLAVSGNTYYISVDGHNPFPPSSGFYDINDTNEGPFRLYWGPAVEEAPHVKNRSLLSVTGSTATYQFDLFMGTPTGGSYWGIGTLVNPPNTVSSGGSSSGVGFASVTTTVTATGLQSNSLYQGAVRISNPFVTSEFLPYDTFFISPNFWTLMPVGFGTCPPDLEKNFTGADCTAPADFTLDPGFRIQGNAMGAYEWQEKNTAQLIDTPNDYTISSSGTALKQEDAGITISQVSLINRIGFGPSSGNYYVQYDNTTSRVGIYRATGSVRTLLIDTAMSLNDGDGLGCRFSLVSNDIDAFVRVGGVWSHVLNVHDTTYTTGSFKPFFTQTAPPGPPTVNQSDAYNLSLLGQTPPGSAALFPPFSCPDGVDKYSWHYDGSLGGDPGGSIGWSGPYFGGATTHDIPAQTCPVWWLDMAIYVFGRIDCYNGVWGEGDQGVPQFYLASNGASEATVPMYPDVTDYNTVLTGLDGAQGSGFFTWDADSARKAFGAIESTIPLIQAVFASQGAYIYDNLQGGKHSYGLFMPVKVAAGRMDDFFLSYGRCTTEFGVVSFSDVRIPKRRGVAHAAH